MAFINDNFKLATLALAVTAAGPIATAALSVDIASSFNVTYTGAAAGVLTLPNPTDAQAGDRAIIVNLAASTAAFTIGGTLLQPGQHIDAVWNGAAWTFQSTAGRNQGASVSVAAAPAGALLVTHNLAMPAGTFSNVIVRAYNSLGNEVVLRRNKAADTANVVGFTLPAAITTNLPLVFDIVPLA
jgi:hypothetical protein